MITAYNKIRLSNLRNDKIWIVLSMFCAIFAGVFIVYGKWLYMGILLIPIFIYLCIVKPSIFPFGAYVFLLPFDSILTISGEASGATLTRFLGILTILVLSLKGVFEKKLTRPDNATIFLMIFIMYRLLSFFWAPSPEKVISVASTSIGLLILYMVVSTYKIHKSEFDTLKWLILTGGLLAAIYSISLYLFGNVYTTEGRATMIAGDKYYDANFFAFTLIIPFSICIHMIMNQSKKSLKVLCFIMLVTILFSIMITASRGASLSVGLIFIIYILSAKRKNALVTTFIIIGSLMITYFIPDLLIERWGEAAERGGNIRLDIWYIGWHAFKKYWLYGVGLNNFPFAFDEFGYLFPSLGTGYGSHNIFIGISVEHGIIGITLLVLAIREHYRAINSRTANMIMLRASFWGILTASFFIETLYLKSFWLLWMMIMMQKNVTEQELSPTNSILNKLNHT